MEYAQARIQARFGARPRTELWRELDAVPDLEAYLEAARGTSLQRWISGIEPDADLHRIDSGLRARLESHIAEVARWLPEEWRPAALWLPRLLDLSAIQHLSSGGAALAWMLERPELRELAAAERSRKDRPEAPDFLLRHRKKARRGGAARADEVTAAFLEEWLRRRPGRDPESLRGMQRIAATISSHLERFGRAGLRDAWRERSALERELRRLFRESALRPEAAFSHLALVALDLERLRAALVRRVISRRERRSA